MNLKMYFSQMRKILKIDCIYKQLHTIFHLLKMGGRKSKFLSRFNIAQLNGLMSNACQQYNRLMLDLGDINLLSNGASVYFAKAKLF